MKYLCGREKKFYQLFLGEWPGIRVFAVLSGINKASAALKAIA
jgi:hypothetical protein